MAQYFFDRVLETTLTTGNGITLELEGAENAFQGFGEDSSWGNPLLTANDLVVEYCIEYGDQFEVGKGVYDPSNNTISRSVVLLSTHPTFHSLRLDLPAGRKRVYATVSARTLTELARVKEAVYFPSFAEAGGASIAIAQMNGTQHGQNVCIFGVSNLLSLTSGSNNVAIGLSNGPNITTGDRNVFIGVGTGAGGNYSNRLFIGNGPNSNYDLIEGNFHPDTQHFSPRNDNQADLGIEGQRWRHAEFAGNVHISGNLTVDGDAPGGDSTIPTHYVGHRLTTHATDPYILSNVSGATVLRFLPYVSNLIRLHDGEKWVLVESSGLEFDITIDEDFNSSAIATNTTYGVFVNYNSGTPKLELVPIYTTARQDGVRVLSGEPTLLYVGIVRTGSSVTINDTLSGRHVANLYNQKPKDLFAQSTTSHSYNGGSRAWNNDTGFRATFVCPEPQVIQACIFHTSEPSGATPAAVGVNVNTTSSIGSIRTEIRSSVISRLEGSGPLGVNEGFNYAQALQTTESGGSAQFYQAQLMATVRV